MTKQLNTVQLDRLAEIKEEILVLLSEALDLVRGTPEEQRANPLVRDLLHSVRQGQYSRQRLHNHHAGDHRCPERKCRRLVLVAHFQRGAPNVRSLVFLPTRPMPRTGRISRGCACIVARDGVSRSFVAKLALSLERLK